MRQFKFRAWSKQLSRWLTKDEWHFDFDGNIHFIDLCPESTERPVAPHIIKKQFVIQQFTGILDRNKKEIYEGDIVKDSSSYYSTQRLNVVEWITTENGQRGWDGFYGYPGEQSNREIIGNIFENPELLK
jgi:uncharacterized phage protein (TIGR01671 family)